MVCVIHFRYVEDAVDSNQSARDVHSIDSSQLARDVNYTNEHSSLNFKGSITQLSPNGD
jgi:hypothetical protein